MTSVLFDYLVLKPAKFGLSNGVHAVLPHGTRVPADEAATWGGRAIDLLVEQGKIAPVPAEDGTADEFYAAYPAEDTVDEPAVEDASKPEVTFPQHVVAAKFLLSDGTEVQGKAAALEAQAKLDEAVDA